ncbi:MAG: GNAT family N-acetyltransferase [Phototrophicaceae bacterium]|jgi:ribosomal protein S18 acetylase RimI-like enzyme
MNLRKLTVADGVNEIPQLVALLVNVVDDGASIGFLPPLDVGEAETYWRDVLESVHSGKVHMWVAEVAGQIVGTIQLAPSLKGNARHRAEVQKLMVHTAFRQRGIARTLMLTAEAEAHALPRKLLVLDTREGDPSNRLYLSLGYVEAGRIPYFAENGDGNLDTTVLYYKLISSDGI